MRNSVSTEETYPISARYLAAIIIAVLALSDVAHADLRGTTEEPPVFSVAEDRIIGRNEALGLVARTDPWLARQVLDALAVLDSRPEALERASLDIDEVAPEKTEAGDVKGSFDPEDNPDLRRLERASPEALYDLFQVLKQASSGQQQAK